MQQRRHTQQAQHRLAEAEEQLQLQQMHQQHAQAPRSARASGLAPAPAVLDEVHPHSCSRPHSRSHPRSRPRPHPRSIHAHVTCNSGARGGAILARRAQREDRPRDPHTHRRCRHGRRQRRRISRCRATAPRRRLGRSTRDGACDPWDHSPPEPKRLLATVHEGQREQREPLAVATAANPVRQPPGVPAAPPCTGRNGYTGGRTTTHAKTGRVAAAVLRCVVGVRDGT